MRHEDPLELLRAAAARAAVGRDRTTTVAGTVHDDSADPAATATVEPQATTDDSGALSLFDGVEATGARRRRRKRSATRNAVEWVLVLVGALIVALVVKTWLFQAFYIPSGSMEPTLEVGDRVLVTKLSYDLDDVSRGDIVVFERPDSWGTGTIEDLIKRVIGLPGETIEVRDGTILVDGDPLEEPWLPDGVSTPAFFRESGCVPRCTLDTGEIFVLGDNRSNSDASNHFGPLPFDDVVGRAFIRVWPIGSFGGL